jgi:multisubunit Na+/H+ antiporter MnhB subunit
MKSVILTQTARLLMPLLVVVSLVVLYRGHNLPGGGFIGGLLFSVPFALVAIADGVTEARRRLKVSPTRLIAVGLGVCLLSGVFAVIRGGLYMEGQWLPGFTLPLLGAVHLGTPIIFDIGVFLAVVGFTLKVFFSLGEEQDESWN